ncbi:hypothetical protein [Nocardia sp. NPDC004860]
MTFPEDTLASWAGPPTPLASFQQVIDRYGEAPALRERVEPVLAGPSGR